LVFNYVRQKLVQERFVLHRDIIEIRFHGRGGQGAVTAANILVAAAWKSGLWGQAFPFFGAERRGAPVMAFARLSKKRVMVRSMIRHPDIVVVLDPKLPELVNVLDGLKPGGKVVINSPSPPKLRKDRYNIYYVDATKIALDLGLVLAGWPLVNTSMLGALAKVIGLPIENVKEAIIDYIGKKGGELNAKAAERAYNEVKAYE